MSNKHLDKNPYANPDGTPIDGKESEFFAWARERELERRKSLPDKERKEVEASERALAKRMDS